MEHQPKRPTSRVVAKYALFQLPEMAGLAGLLLLADIWWDVPGWAYAAVLGAWAVKEVALFPYLWRSFDDRARAYSYTMEDRAGVCLDRLAPAGRVRVRGEVWRAELRDPGQVLEAGQAVRVVGTRGLVLLVAADGQEDGPN